ncbi:AMP phosphorylase [Candidatus Micrarchaeota archaeon]|nr:AMP phosphorylase [Candidatus Micrarchaeota archaeon]MBD3417597.1 AMP phosphorylase [Candidatus Micrarchaeota archaeon]
MKPVSVNEKTKNNAQGRVLSQEEKEKREKKKELWEKKKYICQVKLIDICTEKNIVVLNMEDAEDNDIYNGYRVTLHHDSKEIVSLVDLSSEMVKRGEIGLFRNVAEKLKLKDGDLLHIKHMERPASLDFIRMKLDGESLTSKQISSIINELMNNRLSEAELSSFISAVYIRGMGEDETVALTNAIVDSGDNLDLGVGPVADKHCIGGVAGNRTTMVITPIIAASGIYMPKTSSRAITSAAGTADTMEVLADVDFNIHELKEIVTKCKGAMVWGGGTNIAAADDKLIKLRNPMSLDPRGMLLASILAKKSAVGAKYVAIDIPIGRGAKILDMPKAEALGADFIKIGKRLGMTMESLITDGAEPVGNGIGCALECKDVMEVLQGKGPHDLRNKSTLIAGRILELVGKVPEGQGRDMAELMLTNGKAWNKMKEIIELQGGNPNIKEGDLPIGQHKHTITAERAGKISHIDNKGINKIARSAGAPRDKGAGVYLHRLKGDRVKEGDVLFDIYAESESKLDFAIKAVEVWKPVELEKFLLGTMR